MSSADDDLRRLVREHGEMQFELRRRSRGRAHAALLGLSIGLALGVMISAGTALTNIVGAWLAVREPHCGQVGKQKFNIEFNVLQVVDDDKDV